jgi:hypothetical protein
MDMALGMIDNAAGYAGVSGKARGIIRNAAQKAIGMAKKTRSSRKAKGKRLLFAPKSYQGGGWVRRAGRKRGGGNRQGGLNLRQSAIPNRTTVSQNVRQPQIPPVQKTDTSFYKVDFTAGDADPRIDYMPIYASNTNMFPSLSVQSSQAGYYRFTSVIINYTPTPGSSQSGTFAMGVAPTYGVAYSCSDESAISSLGANAKCAVTQPITMTINGSQMNSVYKFFEVAKTGDFDQTDPKFVQGWLVTCVSGMNDVPVAVPQTAPTVIHLGTLTVTYTCTFNSPIARTNGQGVGAFDSLTSEGMEDTDDILGHWLELENHPYLGDLILPSVDDDGVTTLTFDLKTPFIFGLEWIDPQLGVLFDNVNWHNAVATRLMTVTREFVEVSPPKPAGAAAKEIRAARALTGFLYHVQPGKLGSTLTFTKGEMWALRVIFNQCSGMWRTIDETA